MGSRGLGSHFEETADRKRVILEPSSAHNPKVVSPKNTDARD